MRGFVQHQLEILQPRSGPRLERARRNRVHADALRSEFKGEVAAGELQRRLDRAHDVVVPNNSVRANIAHGEHGAAVCHQRRRKLGHPDEGMARDVHRPGEAIGRAVEKAALKILLGRKGDRMDENVEPSPPDANLVKDRLQLSRDGNVNFARDRGFQLSGERFDKAPRLLVQPRNGEVGPDGAERLGAAVGDGILVGDSDHERFLPGQHWAQLYVAHPRAPFTEGANPLSSAEPPPP